MTKMFDLIKGSKYATGIDLSSHKGDFTIDLNNQAMLDALDFVILRAGYVGYESLRCTTDMFFHGYYDELVRYPEARRGAYWYFSSAVTWGVQFDYFTSLIDEKDFDFIAGDFETINNVPSESFARNFESFMNALEAKYPDKKIFIYTRKDLYDTWLTPYTTNMTRFPLWHAKYPYYDWDDHTEQWFVDWWWRVFGNFTYSSIGLPYERFDDEYDIWQVGDRTRIGDEWGVEKPDVDTNVSRRERQDFLDFIGLPKRLGGVVEPPQPPVVEPPVTGDATLRVTVGDTSSEHLLKKGESITIKVENI
jgi:hypothetical protein